MANASVLLPMKHLISYLFSFGSLALLQMSSLSALDIALVSHMRNDDPQKAWLESTFGATVTSEPFQDTDTSTSEQATLQNADLVIVSLLSIMY